MCNASGIDFARRALTTDAVRGKRVLEVGSYDTSGSVRPVVEALGPASYVGVDIAPGPRVDVICDVLDLEQRFGPASFDVVIATEIVEHVLDWRRAWSNMKAVLRPGGTLLITTRSRGFPFHRGPFDFWRYELDDMRAIHADFEIDLLESDPLSPGVFVCARKSHARDPMNLDDVTLYAVITRRRSRIVSRMDIARFAIRHPTDAIPGLVPPWLKRPWRRVLWRLGVRRYLPE